MFKTSEHDDLMRMFERQYPWCRLDREDREMWTKSRIYQSGETNELFLAFRNGYSYGKALHRAD